MARKAQPRPTASSYNVTYEQMYLDMYIPHSVGETPHDQCRFANERCLWHIDGVLLVGLSDLVQDYHRRAKPWFSVSPGFQRSITQALWMFVASCPLLFAHGAATAAMLSIEPARNSTVEWRWVSHGVDHESALQSAVPELHNLREIRPIQCISVTHIPTARGNST